MAISCKWATNAAASPGFKGPGGIGTNVQGDFLAGRMGGMGFSVFIANLLSHGKIISSKLMILYKHLLNTSRIVFLEFAGDIEIDVVILSEEGGYSLPDAARSVIRFCSKMMLLSGGWLILYRPH